MKDKIVTLDIKESISVNGGCTSLAYDIGSALNILWNGAFGNPGGAGTTAGNWAYYNQNCL